MEFMKIFCLLMIFQSCLLFKPSVGTKSNPLVFALIKNQSYELAHDKALDFIDFENFILREHQIYVKIKLLDYSDDLIFRAKNENYHSILISTEMFGKYHDKISYSPHFISIRKGRSWYKSAIM